MNAVRRKKLNLAADLLAQAREIIDKVLEDEQDALDNMPENLECSEQVARMEDAVDSMESSLESLDETVDYVLEAAS